MLNWVSTLTKYLNKFLELGILIISRFSNSRDCIWTKCSFFWFSSNKKFN